MSKPKKIAQYTLKGEFIRIFESAAEAAKSLGKQGRGDEIKVVCLFKRHYAFDSRWLYEEDMPRAKELFEEHPIPKTKTEKVAQFSLEGEYIRTFDNAVSACDFLGKRGSTEIISCCEYTQRYAYGFRWLYEAEIPRAKELFEQYPLHNVRGYIMPKYSEDEIREAAKTCPTKQSFRDKYSAMYYQAMRDGIWDTLVFERVINPYKDNCYAVYAIPFYETNTVYVGLTDNLTRRWWQHNNTESDYLSAALQYSLKTGIPMPEYPVIIEENLYALEALYYEDFWKEWYESQGMNVLNKAKTGVSSGSLGGAWRRPNKDVFEAAAKCETYNEFQHRFPSEYCLAVRRNLLGKLNLHYKINKDGTYRKKNGTYSEEHCYNFMRQFKTTKEVLEANHYLYDTAMEKGWLPQYWWLYDARITPVIKTTGFKIKIYSSPKNCYTENKLKKSTLLRSIKSGNPRNGSYYHYLDISDIEFDIPDFEHRYII